MRFLCVYSLTASSTLTLLDEEHGETNTARNENETANGDADDSAQAKGGGGGYDVARSAGPARNQGLGCAKPLIATIRCWNQSILRSAIGGCSTTTGTSENIALRGRR